MHERQHIPLHSIIAEAHTTASCLENAAVGWAYGVCKTQDRAFPVPSYSTWVPAPGDYHRPSRFKVCQVQALCSAARVRYPEVSVIVWTSLPQARTFQSHPGTSHSLLCSLRYQSKRHRITCLACLFTESLPDRRRELPPICMMKGTYVQYMSIFARSRPSAALGQQQG